jgi:N-acetylmuramoyl-L-alanine amidase
MIHDDILNDPSFETSQDDSYEGICIAEPEVKPMMARRAGWFTLLLIVMMVAGCQTSSLSVSPPSFEPPTVRPGRPTPLPPAGTSVVPFRPGAPTIIAPRPGAADPILQAVLMSKNAKPRAWRYIVVHHSDTPAGSARKFDAAHRARGWEMLGYDFVIGNGTETRDGQIEPGPRWVYQYTGAHTGTPDHKYNDYGIGICLVGNFENTRPTQAQMESLARLCAYFMRTYKIPATSILGHRDCKHTACPGANMDIKLLRQMAAAYAK